MTIWLIRGPTSLRSTLMPVPSRVDLTAGRALRVHIQRIDRVARRHEQPVALDPAEAHVGATLGQCDEADRLTARIENLDAVLLCVAHAPAAPKIAVDIAAETVRHTARLGGDEGTAVGELVVVDVVDADHPRVQAGFDDVELLLVGREGQPVRTVDLAGHYRRPPGLRIEPVQ